MYKVLTGNEAAAYAAMNCKVRFVAAYPITPATSVVEMLSRFIDEGRMKAKFVHVESEHSAMAACIGASAGGLRVFTATSSQGLAYMHEMLHWAANARTPVVMTVANREHWRRDGTFGLIKVIVFLRGILDGFNFIVVMFRKFMIQ